jgi:hypothetical protein
MLFSLPVLGQREGLWVMADDIADEAEANDEVRLLGYSLSGFRVGIDAGPGNQPALARQPLMTPR